MVVAAEQNFASSAKANRLNVSIPSARMRFVSMKKITLNKVLRSLQRYLRITVPGISRPSAGRLCACWRSVDSP